MGRTQFGARLAEILLHMAGLTIALITWIEVAVARTFGIAAVRPLCICALDRESAHPFVQLILDWERIRYVVARGAHLRAHEHRLMESFVFLGIHVLVLNIFSKYGAGVHVFQRWLRIRGERTE